VPAGRRGRTVRADRVRSPGPRARRRPPESRPRRRASSDELGRGEVHASGGIVPRPATGLWPTRPRDRGAPPRREAGPGQRIEKWSRQGTAVDRAVATRDKKPEKEAASGRHASGRGKKARTHRTASAAAQSGAMARRLSVHQLGTEARGRPTDLRSTPCAAVGGARRESARSAWRSHETCAVPEYSSRCNSSPASHGTQGGTTSTRTYFERA